MNFTNIEVDYSSRKKNVNVVWNTNSEDNGLYGDKYLLPIGTGITRKYINEFIAFSASNNHLTFSVSTPSRANVKFIKTLFEHVTGNVILPEELQ